MNPTRPRRALVSAALLIALSAPTLRADAATATGDDPPTRTATIFVTADLGGQLQPDDRTSVAHLAAFLRQLQNEARERGDVVLTIDAGRTLAPYAESRHDGGATMMQFMLTAGHDQFVPAPMDLSSFGLDGINDAAENPLQPPSVLLPLRDPAQLGYGNLRSHGFVLVPPRDGDGNRSFAIATVSLYADGTLDRLAFGLGDDDALTADKAFTLQPLRSQPSIELRDADLRIAVIHSARHSAPLATRTFTWGLLDEPHDANVLIAPDLDVDLELVRGGDDKVFLAALDDDGPWTVMALRFTLADDGKRWRPTDMAVTRHELDPSAVERLDTQLVADIRANLDSFRDAANEPLPDGAPTTRAGLEQFVLDTMREAADAEVVILNEGGLRPTDPTVFDRTPLTREALLRMLSLDQVLVTGTLTGAQLKALAVESAKRMNADGTRRLSALRFGGMTFDVTGAGTDDAAVDSVEINGRPLFDSDDYAIATTAFLSEGGDDYDALSALDTTVVRQGGKDGKRAAEIRDDLVAPRLAEAARPFEDLRRKPLWRFHIDEISLSLEQVNTTRDDDAYADVSDSRITADDTTTISTEARLRAEQLWPSFSWETGLYAAYGEIRDTDSDESETEDLIRLESALVFTRTKVWGAVPFAGVGYETEFTATRTSDGDTIERKQLFDALAGLDWRRGTNWPRLRLGVLARRQDDTETSDRFGLFGEVVYQKEASGSWPAYGGRLWVERVEDSAAVIQRVDLEIGLQLTLTDVLLLKPTYNIYLFEDDRFDGSALYQDFSISLAYSWSGKRQTR
ncbi:MAG: 5'-nucleotidase C-terminal domain-containing protein [Acidobacteriota bacterium]